MTDKLSLIESIVNENAVDFRQIVNKVLLEKLAIRLDEQYHDVAKTMFVLSEAEEDLEEDDTESEDYNEEGEEEMEADLAPEAGTDRISRSYGTY
jgi:hypothetical protein